MKFKTRLMSFKTLQCPDQAVTQFSEWTIPDPLQNSLGRVGTSEKDIDKLVIKKNRKQIFRMRLETWGMGKRLCTGVSSNF